MPQIDDFIFIYFSCRSKFKKKRKTRQIANFTNTPLHFDEKKNMGRDHSPSGDRRERRREKDKNRRRHRSRSVEKSRERKRSRSPRDRHVDRKPRSESPIDVDKPTRHSIYIRTVSSYRILSTLVIQYKLVYGPFGQS